MVPRAVLLAFRDSIRWEPILPDVVGGVQDPVPRAWLFHANVDGRQVVTRVFHRSRFWYRVGGRLLSKDTFARAQSAVEAWWLKQLEDGHEANG